MSEDKTIQIDDSDDSDEDWDWNNNNDVQNKDDFVLDFEEELDDYWNINVVLKELIINMFYDV